jgi:SNF2 family DNA or RNA helicase
MTLVGCKMKWEEKEKEDKPYRAIIGGPKALTGQWLSESGRFFPGAQVFNLTTTNLDALAKRLQTHDLQRPAYPLLVIGSYGAVKKAMPHLLSWRWDDVVIDEAAFLKGSSKQSAAFWQLRQQADCAVALTGTPIDKGLNDMGAILSWVRNDASLFSGQKLDRFNITNQQDLKNLWKAVGPVIFRRDRSEISDQLPKIKTEVLMYEPHATEKALADGARKELRKILLEMEDNIEKQIQIAAKSKNSGDLEALEEAQKEIRSIRGTVLGGVTLARMAASDPQSLVESESMGAALLDGAGLIEPAAKHGGTKRKEMVKYIQDKVDNKGAILVFTDFTAVASTLEEELKAAGMRVEPHATLIAASPGLIRNARTVPSLSLMCWCSERVPKKDLTCSVLII